MADSSLDVLVDADPRARVAVRPFLLDGALHLAVVMKTTLRLVDQGPARIIDPAPIVEKEVPWHPHSGASIQRADDLALMKRLCDVTVVGSEMASGGPSASRSNRLALVRNGRTVLDKSVSDLHRRAGFGPVAATWPSRSARVPELHLKSLRSALPEIPNTFSWSYFQSAPSDLQIDFLHGDEWVLLEGFNAERPTMRTRLPNLEARGYIASQSSVIRFALSLDTLAIDMNDSTASVVHRGVLATGPIDARIIAVHLSAAGEAFAACDVSSVQSRARPHRFAMPRVADIGALHETVLPSASRAPHPAVNAGAPFALATPVSERHGALAQPMVDKSREAPPWMNVRHTTPAGGSPRTVALVMSDLLPSYASYGSEPGILNTPPLAPPMAQPMVTTAAVSRSAAPPVAPVPNHVMAIEPLEADELHREDTPPSRAAIAASELRAAGLSEDRVREIMRTLATY